MGYSMYERERTRKRDQIGNGKGLIIINNQPFQRGCHGSDLVRVNLNLVIVAWLPVWPCDWCLGVLWLR